MPRLTFSSELQASCVHHHRLAAPVIGWGRYETFEFGCTVAFHDKTTSVRAYVVVMLVVVLAGPLTACGVYYAKITFFSYEVKLQLFQLQEPRAKTKEEGQEEGQPPQNGGENGSQNGDMLTLSDLLEEEAAGAEGAMKNEQASKGVVSLVDKKLTRVRTIPSITIASMYLCACCTNERERPKRSNKCFLRADSSSS